MQETRLRVLFVDDDEDTRLMMTLLLGMSNYEVVTAASVTSALEVAQKAHFDVYVLDNRFPDGTGKELCEGLRQFDQLTPIIFYSGDAYEADKERAFSWGAQDYVVKPYVDTLPKAIARTTLKVASVSR